jgi:LuxR family maltose regulon positive regulatory protein
MEGEMTAPLLRIKLFFPPIRPGLVPRPHLLERLDAGLHCKLTLICAPAGFGKTTLLSEWAADTHQPIGWVSLDNGDNTPMRFWTYVIAALEGLLPGVGDAARSLLHAPQPSPIELVLTTLINDITTAMEGNRRVDDYEKPAPIEAQSRPYTLVLDDYHAIEAPPIHAALAFLLDHLPTNLHLVIATRADLPLRLSLLRARGQLVEIRAADLRFTVDEAAAFLNQTIGLKLSEKDVAALERRTEGWITGLQMAALALQGIPAEAEQTRFVEAFSGSHRFVLDYLVEEVLSQQSADVQDFLWQTAVLERFTAPLCDAVTGQDNGQTMLATLDQANLFLIPLDDDRRWYRYHHLFADLLRARSRDDADWVRRHRRAAEWYQAHGFTEDAFEHWVKAGALAEAAALVETQALTHLNQGQTTLVLAWVDRLPTDLVASHPWLLIFRAWGLLLTGEVTAVPACLGQAEQAATAAAAASEVAGHLAAMRAYMAAIQGDVSTTIAQAQQALAQLRPDDLAIRSVVAFVLGGMHLLVGELVAAQSAFTEAAQTGQAADNRHVAVPAWCAVAYLQLDRGQLREAEATYHKALDLAMTQRKRPLPLAAQPYNGLARLAYERNDLIAASEWLDKSLRLSRQWHSPETTVYSLLARAAIHRAQGSLDEATAAWQEAAAVAETSALTPLSASRLTATRQELWLATGDVAAAARSASGRGVTADTPLSYVREAEHVALVRILLAQGRAGEARALLGRLAAAAQKDGRSGSLIKLLALQAVVYQTQRQMEQARSALGHALSLAGPEGYVRTFVDEGLPMARLLTEIKTEGGRTAVYADKLLAAFPDLEAEPSVIGDQGSAMVEPLSDRELEVLQLISIGLSNQAIADELVVALGTVKAHTAAIYRKLDVSSRTQAVARARALGLIA